MSSWIKVLVLVFGAGLAGLAAPPAAEAQACETCEIRVGIDSAPYCVANAGGGDACMTWCSGGVCYCRHGSDSLCSPDGDQISANVSGDGSLPEHKQPLVPAASPVRFASTGGAAPEPGNPGREQLRRSCDGAILQRSYSTAVAADLRRKSQLLVL